MEICISVQFVVLFVVLLVSTVYGGKLAWEWMRAHTLYEEALNWIVDHRARIKGDNRFPVGENYFSQHFYEYSPKIVRRVWMRLVKEGLIQSDPIDGEWIVK